MQRFSKIQISLHWITLLLIAIAYISIEFRGLFTKNSPAYLLMREVHYNAGVLIWIAMLIRLGLRHILPDPPILPPPPRWQHLAARMMYLTLYLWFLAIPLLGIALMAYSGKSWSLFGLTIAPWVTPDPAIKSMIKEWHVVLANLGYALIAMHTAAALFHHYVIRDNALLLMMPQKKTR
ncbi:cytochrome b [Edwardsiella ictaluri]|uniref:Nickel-dependent hydrogenases b-type cytochrome subunit protein n=2 Tax=Edwardsiella ictaluri TaxID=67780 RepID=C5B8H1_EDWI9|nr:cytochrome b [Edwardsiella ictaluri]ACR69832.1 nickel-dependent hydrogenases b-type cytochrome subunit protein [Edwardsiella ictaluri 93-146]AVZ83221.1 cytochrome b [Edwardsiella ictaluri]EKS7761905.1 cytochrome b [Edwardsiella ictaluri]EKS7768715.1 cytochrome b [Edwardsiella ictaluri]EKS7771967.1 cytochrome b [Edwardsiella ictaluri]